MAYRKLYTISEPKSLIAESFRVLQTNISIILKEQVRRVVLLTSVDYSSEKSMVAANLAVVLAQAGNRVLVIDCDLHNPELNNYFDTEKKPGLADALKSGSEIGGLIRDTCVAGLKFLPSGAIVHNSSELLCTARMKNLLNEVSQAYDLVLIDSPPVIAFADTAVLSALVDGVALVVKTGKINKNILKDARIRMERANAKVLGIILSQGKICKEYLKQYYHGRQHTDEEDTHIENGQKGTCIPATVRAAKRMDRQSGSMNRGLAPLLVTTGTCACTDSSQIMTRIPTSAMAGERLNQLSGAGYQGLYSLVDTMDKKNPCSVGHATLVSKYAGVIAREMDLDGGYIKDIILAGYLHDVGMAYIPEQIALKNGTYSAVEYETMKLHSAKGAAIVEKVLNNNNIVVFVLHHHERWDGNGYPDGLKGKEIPLGARIITVADVFNSKLTGRGYRNPLTFARALEDLQLISGSHLDPAITRILTGWLIKKQDDPGRKNLSLGLCWEMRCCPPEISGHCPAYNRMGVNCWEIAGTMCSSHGNSCWSCPVYTEFVSRTGTDPVVITALKPE